MAGLVSPKPISYSQYNPPYPRAPTSSSISNYPETPPSAGAGATVNLAHPVPHQPIGSAQATAQGAGAGYMGMNLNMNINMAAVGMNANGLGGNLGGIGTAAGLGNVGMPQVGAGMAGSVAGVQDDDKIYALVIDLLDPETRDTALLELSKKREQYDDLALVLWHSFGM